MKQDIPEPVFLSAPKAATLCGVSRNTICCWIRDGKLPSYRTAGGKYLIRPGDLQTFMEEHRMFVPQALVDIAAQDELTNQGISSGAPAAEAAPAAPADEAGRSTSREPAVLIVDDDPNARMLAVRTIQKLNVPVLQAENGFEAMHLLMKHPEVALIILDLIMPGQDGVRTFQEIRKMNESIPVIIVTGYPPEHSDEAFGDVLPDLVITKPYQPAHLLSASSAFMQDLGI